MALTLPYPDLDFVPLDILTAEEMNEIVSNYTYIAEYASTTTTPVIVSSTYGISYVKVGNVVNVQVAFASTTANPGQVLATMPVGARPALDQVELNGFDNQRGEFVIDTDGSVQYMSNSGASDYGRASFCYAAAN